MNKFMQLGAALGGAALVVAAGSAYTASSSVPATNLGYGTATVTGVTVEAVNYTLSSDKAKVEAVAYTVTALATGDVRAVLTLSDTAGTEGKVQSINCVTTSTTVLTCTSVGAASPFDLGFPVADLNKVNLSVTSSV